MAISLNLQSEFRYKARRIRFMKEMGVLALQWREDTKSISRSIINGVGSKVMVRLRVTNIVDHCPHSEINGHYPHSAIMLV
jgi:hypothetical protein